MVEGTSPRINRIDGSRLLHEEINASPFLKVSGLLTFGFLFVAGPVKYAKIER
jgi:hypothetical protein